MPTKFILHGGFNKGRESVQEDDHFFKEMVKDLTDEARILLVYFAEREEKIPRYIIEDQDQFKKSNPIKTFEFRVATEETFVEDCAWADLIYLHGGKTVKILETMEKFDHVEEIFKDKTVGGDSAGANCLGVYSFSKNSKEIRKGLSLIPYKIVAHYEKGTPNPLADIEPEIETILLEEYETKFFLI